MSITSKEEHEALSHANGNAAIQEALALLHTDKEAIRAGYWNRIDQQTRKMICHIAGIGAENGDKALRDLNAFERGRINIAAQRLIRSLEIIVRCAQGGEIPHPQGMMQ